MCLTRSRHEECSIESNRCPKGFFFSRRQQNSQKFLDGLCLRSNNRLQAESARPRQDSALVCYFPQDERSGVALGRGGGDTGGGYEFHKPAMICWP